MERSANVLVIGGGIAGMQASLDLADQGFKVYLVEKTSSIGGRMAQLDKTFPTMDCSICILAPKMIECDRHPNIKLLTYSEVKEVSGSPGNFTVKILKKPRHVDEEKCTGCDECTKQCPVTMPDEFNMGLGMRKAIYRPFPQAVPRVFVIEKRGTPPCRVACPAGINVQGYIALIKQGKFKEALELIRRENPFPLVCGRVCFHPCEAECERGKVDEPLAINALKRFVADYELKHGKREKAIPKASKERIAIIGSGPAGLTAAYELVKKGYPVTVFESLPTPGGMLKIGIPEYRLPKEALNVEIDYIKDLGVDIRTNTTVGKDLTILGLLQDGYEAIFIAVGAQKSRKLGIEGEELTGVIHALHLLQEVNLEEKVELGDRVAVIGGGNVAVDVARTAIRLGTKDVKILYRRSRMEMPANPVEVEEAEKEGIKIHFLVTPTKILGNDGKVTAIECIRMELGKPDETGRRRPIPIKGSEYIIEIDTAIPAIGEFPDISLLPKEIQVTRRNTIAVDPITLETSLPGVFAGGDAVSGPATVIEAIATGKRAAVSIDRYLGGEDLRAGREEEIKRAEEIPKEGVEKKARQVTSLLPLNQRIGNFKEVELGFTEEMAVGEAGRCLFCGVCSECLECEKVCEPKAVIQQQKEEYVQLKIVAIIVATGFTSLNPSEIKQYGYGRHKNVLTALELERLLSASGPTSGKLIRPSDNAKPHKIAFIQCVGSRDVRSGYPYCSRDVRSGYPYCSSVCCMHATKEAVIIKEHEPDSEAYIFYTDLRAFGKGFREFLNRAKNEWDIKYIRAKPGALREDPKTKDIIIRYEDTLDGDMKELKANLVILSTALIPRRDQELVETLGVEVDQYGFFKAPHPLRAPFDSTVPGIFLCGCCQGPKDIPDSVAQASGAAARVTEIVALMSL